MDGTESEEDDFGSLPFLLPSNLIEEDSDEDNGCPSSSTKEASKTVPKTKNPDPWFERAPFSVFESGVSTRLVQTPNHDQEQQQQQQSRLQAKSSMPICMPSSSSSPSCASGVFSTWGLDIPLQSFDTFSPFNAHQQRAISPQLSPTNDFWMQSFGTSSSAPSLPSFWTSPFGSNSTTPSTAASPGLPFQSFLSHANPDRAQSFFQPHHPLPSSTSPSSSSSLMAQAIQGMPSKRSSLPPLSSSEPNLPSSHSLEPFQHDQKQIGKSQSEMDLVPFSDFIELGQPIESLEDDFSDCADISTTLQPLETLSPSPHSRSSWPSRSSQSSSSSSSSFSSSSSSSSSSPDPLHLAKSSTSKRGSVEKQSQNEQEKTSNQSSSSSFATGSSSSAPQSPSQSKQTVSVSASTSSSNGSSQKTPKKQKQKQNQSRDQTSSKTKNTSTTTTTTTTTTTVPAPAPALPSSVTTLDSSSDSSKSLSPKKPPASSRRNSKKMEWVAKPKELPSPSHPSTSTSTPSTPLLWIDSISSSETVLGDFSDANSDPKISQDEIQIKLCNQSNTSEKTAFGIGSDLKIGKEEKEEEENSEKDQKERQQQKQQHQKKQHQREIERGYLGDDDDVTIKDSNDFLKVLREIQLLESQSNISSDIETPAVSDAEVSLSLDLESESETDLDVRSNLALDPLSIQQTHSLSPEKKGFNSDSLSLDVESSSLPSQILDSEPLEKDQNKDQKNDEKEILDPVVESKPALEPESHPSFQLDPEEDQIVESLLESGVSVNPIPDPDPVPDPASLSRDPSEINKEQDNDPKYSPSDPLSDPPSNVDESSPKKDLRWNQIMTLIPFLVSMMGVMTQPFRSGSSGFLSPFSVLAGFFLGTFDYALQMMKLVTRAHKQTFSILRKHLWITTTIFFVYLFPLIASPFTYYHPISGILSPSSSVPSILWYGFFFWAFLNRGCRSSPRIVVNLFLLIMLAFVCEVVCSPRQVLIWSGGDRLVLALVLLCLKSNSFFKLNCFLPLSIFLMLSTAAGNFLTIQWAILVFSVPLLHDNFFVKISEGKSSKSTPSPSLRARPSVSSSPAK